MLACDEGNIEMVDLLLQYSADPNLQQPVSKIEVLYSTCSVCWEIFALVCSYSVWKHYVGPWYKHINTSHSCLKLFIDSSISKVSPILEESFLLFGRETICICPLALTI